MNSPTFLTAGKASLGSTAASLALDECVGCCLGFWDQNADDMTRESEGVAPVADRTGPFLPAVGLGRPVKLVFEPEVRVACRARHAEHRLGGCHFGDAVVGGVDMALPGGSSPIHTWVHLSQR